MAASGTGRPRRGPAPIASFDHDVSEESSPETKQSIRLPEIREDLSSSKSSVAACGGENSLAPPEQRARSHSSPAVHSAASPASAAPTALQTPAAPRIDISRASSSSHHDSRDSSPELALFAGGEDSKTRLELGFREDGALELRSSTEELAFLEGAPGGPEPKPPAAPPSRRHSRKDSQGSEAALLGVSGRTSRLSSVGSQCSAHSALSGFSHTSRVSRLSVVSGVSRSPSPHKMLLETSFCGPKPIENDPEICAAAVEERLLEIAKLSTETITSVTVTQPSFTFATTVDARDRREVRTEATVENTRPASATRLATTSPQPVSVAPNLPAASTTSPISSIAILDDDKRLKETKNRARAEENRTRSKERRDISQPEVYKNSNRTKDIIRIKLKPDDEYDDDDDTSEHTLVGGESARKPVTLELNEGSTRPIETISPQLTPRKPRDSRTPSPTGAAVSRKSSFCSLFKSRETIASPDSPSDALRRKKSLNEGRSRSKSRDRSTTPSSSGKIKGSVLSLFKTPKRSNTSPSPSSRDVSPVVQQQKQFSQITGDRVKGGEKLKYYEDSKDGIIHIPLRTPPDELDKNEDKCERTIKPETNRPASAPQVRGPERNASVSLPRKPIQRTVLPDGSIIIPLHSPTEKSSPEVTSFEAKVEEHTPTPLETATKQQNGCPPPLRKNENSTDIQHCQDVNRMSPVESETNAKVDRQRKKERIIFSTHVGSREQVFSTQFSITKTPSVTSEISESIPSFPESEEVRNHEVIPERTTVLETEVVTDERLRRQEATFKEEEVQSALPERRDSSSSEASLEAAATEATASSEGPGGSEPERRGLVVQESFEELPYVPTTLPQERPVALPMVPVRERATAALVGVQRPRSARGGPLGALPPVSSPPAPSPAPDPTPSRLHIRLPSRPRATSAAQPPPPPRKSRPRSRSGPDGVEVRGKADWIDFSEMPEWRMEPKRIEVLPKGGESSKGGRSEVRAGHDTDRVVFSYVPPEHCRCECHALAEPHSEPHTEPHAELAPEPEPCDDEMPLLDDPHHKRRSSSSLEYEEERAPFTGDLDLQPASRSHLTRPQ